MTPDRRNVLLPLPCPTTKLLRAAVANIIRDIQLKHGETDQDTADRLGVSAGTIVNARNERTDLGALTIAKIGALYGEEALDPYHALYRADSDSDALPVSELADALSAVARCRTQRDRLNALATVKAAIAAASDFVTSTERLRLVS